MISEVTVLSGTFRSELEADDDLKYYIDKGLKK